MEKPQPVIVPVMARIPQVPPQQVAGNRRVYVAPKINRLPQLAHTPLPEPYKAERCIYIKPDVQRIATPQHSPVSIGLLSRYTSLMSKPPIERKDQLTSDMVPNTPPIISNQLFFNLQTGTIPPLLRLPTHTPQTTHIWSRTLETPRPQALPRKPLQWLPKQKAQRTALNSTQSMANRTSAHYKRHEPGVAEALMGCTTLLMLGMIVLSVLYFLSIH